ncbi:MAG: hypothetical protein J6O23_07560, partial [Prevotella sp.]|nr:hypothetical protein [Prevotella sp.]
MTQFKLTGFRLNDMLQSHRKIPNRLFLFPPWAYSIPTIPSMTLPRKISEGGCKRRKRSKG